MSTIKYLVALSAIALSSQAMADSFTNGGFETGDTSGWTTGGGYRGIELNNTLNPTNYLPGGSYYDPNVNHSAVVSAGFAPHTDNNLNQVYSGQYAYRAEDTTYGGYASAIQQTVANYTNANIFFAWAAVLEGAHGLNDAATFKLTLKDVTQGDILVSREYNSASGGSGVDNRFKVSSDGYYYSSWQIEQLDVSQRSGHTFTLSLLAADCEPTGHAGYVYLDGFGSVTPPTTVAEPGSMALLGLGLAGIAGLRRRKTA